MKDKELTVGQTLQLLYKHGLSALPVVNESSQLTGTIEKAGLIRVAGLRDRLHDPLTRHLETLLVRAKTGDESRLRRILFQRGESVPVISSAGRLSHYWHKTISEAPAAERPMPYFGILVETVRVIDVPAGVILEGEPAAGMVNAALLARLGLEDQEAFLTWSQGARWRQREDDTQAHAVRVTDPAGIGFTLIRRQIRVGEQLYGWLYCLQEEHDRRLAELLSDKSEQPAQAAVGKNRTAAVGRRRSNAAPLRGVLEAFERFALARCVGLKKPAHTLFNRLGITRQGMMYKLKKYRLPGPSA